MNFMQWLNSLDELLYEVASWMLFFPLTLIRVLRRPGAMMAYAQAELLQPEDKQYLANLKPPIFLVLSLLLSHAIDMIVQGTNPIIRNNTGLSAMVGDNFSLLLLRVVIFSIFPLVMAAYVTRRLPGGLDRDTLRGPFYAQCYVTAPALVLVSLGTIALEQHALLWRHVGLTALVAAMIFYLSANGAWIALQLNLSRWRGLLRAFLVMLGTLVLVLSAISLFAL